VVDYALSLGIKNAYIQALCKEIGSRRDYLHGEPINTLYFGGGTPSLLNENDFSQIFKTLEQHFNLDECHEITLEANPDDLTIDYIHMLRKFPFNRISMGIQTFHDDLLRMLNRRHNAEEARNAVFLCQEAGFSNISIDLIYGLPGETEELWENDLQQAIQLGVQHISAYHLTYEEDTALYQLRQKGRLHEVSEDNSLLFFSMLIEKLKQAGYEHYEISNFCLPGYHSRHNSSYWEGVPYLGCGPSSHSFDGHSREWNVASVKKYIEGIQTGKRDFEQEQLSLETRYNEMVMTSLRTSKGINLNKLRETFGENLYQYCLKMAQNSICNHHLVQTDTNLYLNEAGIFISDDIISDLMYLDD